MRNLKLLYCTNPSKSGSLPKLVILNSELKDEWSVAIFFKSFRGDTYPGVDLAAQYNLGVARFRLDSIKGATETFKKALSLSKDKTMSAKISYNIGVAFLKSANFQEAIPAFRNSLRLNPEDKQCRENLQYAINEYKKQLNKKQQSANKQESGMSPKQLKEQQKNQLSRQAAEKILQSAQQDESRIRDSLQSKKFRRQNGATKNW